MRIEWLLCPNSWLDSRSWVIMSFSLSFRRPLILFSLILLLHRWWLPWYIKVKQVSQRRNFFFLFCQAACSLSVEVPMTLMLSSWQSCKAYMASWRNHLHELFDLVKKIFISNWTREFTYVNWTWLTLTIQFTNWNTFRMTYTQIHSWCIPSVTFASQ